MPGYERAPISAELKVVTSDRAKRPPQDQIEAAKEAAGASGLAHEAGPETMILAGGRDEVLQEMTKVIDAALDAGAQAVEIKVDAEADADRFE
jgi:uncharacterized protein YqgV (UPF0045/DUF77 family)